MKMIIFFERYHITSVKSSNEAEKIGLMVPKKLLFDRLFSNKM